MSLTPRNDTERTNWTDADRAKFTGAPRSKRLPRTHVVILDGTNSSLDPGCETHAGHLYKLLREVRGDLAIMYEPGLQWSDWRRTWHVATGKGLAQQVSRAYGALASSYRPGDDIYFFGFSRGAYAVRSLAGMIDQIGLLQAQHATQRNVAQAFRHYRAGDDGAEAARAFRDAHCHASVCIEMVGVWDTVKALGLRLPILWQATSIEHNFHNHELGQSIRNGFHALAYHETRRAYEPVLWRVPDGHGSHVEQVWFPGVHGDVGGQLNGDEEARPLANLSLTWMFGKAEECGLVFPEDWRARFGASANAPSIGSWAGWSKVFLARRWRNSLADRSERLHTSLTAGRPKRVLQFGRRARWLHKNV